MAGGYCLLFDAAAGYQPNLPGLQHMYLKNKLNNKRQNELIPYNDCLYRNMYRLVQSFSSQPPLDSSSI
jgi:hypothetical protein